MKTSHKLSAVFVVIVVISIGTYLLVSSHAATPYTSVSASKGTVGNGAILCSDNTSSSGQSVTFGPAGSTNDTVTTPTDSNAAIPMDGNVALALSNPGTPFAPTSFWNTPLPKNICPNPNNAAYLSDIAYDLCHYYPVEKGAPSDPGYPCVIPGNGAPSTSSYSGPLYVVPANQPYVSFSRICNGVASPNVSFDNSIAGGVPIPADAHAAAGTDGEIQIYQPSTNKYWDFWRLVKDSSGNWGACWGGVIDDVSQSDGIIPNNLGATATSLPLLGGVVRIEELQAGQIDHVIGLELDNNLCPYVEAEGATSCTYPKQPPYLATGTISWPATRSDGSDINTPLTTPIPEGLRFRLPANFNLATYIAQLPKGQTLSAVAQTIAVAAQKYGFVVYDTTASVGIRFSDPTTYTNTPSPNLPNPYTTGPGVGGVNNGNQGLFDGVAPYLIFKNFPWGQLEALPFNYGQPAS